MGGFVPANISSSGENKDQESGRITGFAYYNKPYAKNDAFMTSLKYVAKKYSAGWLVTIHTAKFTPLWK